MEGGGMIITKGRYVTDYTDLLVEVLNIPYRNTEYIKMKVNLSNKHNGIVYETRKSYKVYRKNITHWNRYNPWKKV